MERFIEPCCPKCSHTKATPCKDFVKCCLEGPICHQDESCSAKRKSLMSKVALHDNFVIF